MMESSLRDCGFGDSITVDKNGMVISGNQRLESLVSLGFEGEPIVVETDGQRPVIHKRVDLDLTKDKRARLLSIYQNRVGEVNLEWDMEAILGAVSAEDLEGVFTEAEIQKILTAQAAGSDGKFLDLADLTMKDPRPVEKGQRWRVGKHILWCADLMTEWSLWVPDLTGKAVFVPLPGPFVALTKLADRVPRLVMVHRDPWVCGHLLDRYAEIHGEDQVKLAPRAGKTKGETDGETESSLPSERGDRFGHGAGDSAA